ncbi:MAG: hypothetical protein LUD47_07765 [Clostridia bacterium]|nr:hypothetical protein [Clostridia bacterium]
MTKDEFRSKLKKLGLPESMIELDVKGVGETDEDAEKQYDELFELEKEYLKNEPIY